MQRVPVEVIEKISSYARERSGDHFDLFALNKLWARATFPIAISWQEEFARDTLIRDELELEQEARAEAREYCRELLCIADSESSFSLSEDDHWEEESS